MAITYLGQGVLGAVVTGAVTAAFPTASPVADNDIALVVVGTNSNNTLSTPAGWTKILSRDATANESAALYYRRLLATDTAPTFTATGIALGTSNGLYAKMYTWRGCLSTGTPYDLGAVQAAGAISTGVLSATMTSTVAHQLAVCLIAADDDNSWVGTFPSTASSWNVSQRPDAWSVSTTGGDFMIDMIQKPTPTAGTVFAATAAVGTMSASDFWITFDLFLTPEPQPAGTVTVDHLTAGVGTGDPQATASVSPTAGSRLLLAVSVSHSASSPPDTMTITGLGGTWVKASTVAWGSRRRSWIYTCDDWSGSGTISIDGPATVQEVSWVLDQAVGSTALDAVEMTFITPGWSSISDVLAGVPVYGADVKWSALFLEGDVQAAPSSGFQELGATSGGLNSRRIETAWEPTATSTLDGWSWISALFAGMGHGILRGVASSTTPVGKALDLQWDIRKAQADTLDTRWSDRATVPDTTEVRWGVRTPVADAVDTRWALRSKVGAADEFRWSLRAALADTLTAQWADRVKVADAADLRWGIRTPVAVSDEFRWSNRSLVGTSDEFRWALRSKVASTEELRWSLRQSVADALGLVWNVQFGLAPTPIGKALDVRWADRALVLDTLTGQWSVRSLLTDTVNLRWGLRSTVSDTVNPRWSLRSFVADTINARWSLRSRVSDTLAGQWVVRAAIGDQASLQWALRASLSDGITLQWEIMQLAGLASNAIDLRWSTRQAVADAINTQWALRTRVSDAITTPWAIRSRVADTAALQWAARALVADIVNLPWSLRARVSDQAQLSWAVRGRASDSLGLIWNVLVIIRVGQEVTLLWTILANDKVPTHFIRGAIIAYRVSGQVDKLPFSGGTIDNPGQVRGSIRDYHITGPID